jgi:hypothetical protein
MYFKYMPELGLVSPSQLTKATCSFTETHVDPVYPQDWDLKKVMLSSLHLKHLTHLAQAENIWSSERAIAKLAYLSEESVEKYRFACSEDPKHPLNGQFDVRAKKDLPAGAFVALYPGVLETEALLKESDRYVVTLSCLAYSQSTSKVSRPTLYLNAQRPDGHFIDVFGRDTGEPSIAHAINASQTYGAYPSKYDMPTNCAYAFFCLQGQRVPIVFIQTLVPVLEGQSLRADYGPDYFSAQLAMGLDSQIKLKRSAPSMPKAVGIRVLVDRSTGLPVLVNGTHIMSNIRLTKKSGLEPSLTSRAAYIQALYHKKKLEQSKDGRPIISLTKCNYKKEGVLRARIFCSGLYLELSCQPGSLSRERVIKLLTAVIQGISQPSLFIKGMVRESVEEYKLLNVSEVLKSCVFRLYINSLILLEGLQIITSSLYSHDRVRDNLILRDADKACFEERLARVLATSVPCAGAGSGSGAESGVDGPFFRASKKQRKGEEGLEKGYHDVR